MVERWDFQAHRLWSHGECLPSSESLTHAAVYESWPNVECVLHGHAPMIWDCAEGLGLVSTPADVDYGTPEMVQATRVLASTHPQLDFFVMKGHQDGVVSLGNTIDEAGRRLLAVWASAEGWRKHVRKY
ncbi:MAG: class II aldolase/adducin family protein [bacterium]